MLGDVGFYRCVADVVEEKSRCGISRDIMNMARNLREIWTLFARIL